MLWQELAVAVIVGLAVVWLVRHMRGLLVIPQSGGASCHGCDDCGEDEAGTGETARAPQAGGLVRPGAGTIH